MSVTRAASPCNVIVTGQLRTPDRLLQSVREWAAMRDEGLVARVLIVTWDEEASEHEGLCRELEGLGAEMLTRPMPPIRGIGHVWPQTLALVLGLDEIGDDGAWVLKTRADLAIEPGFMRRLLTTPGYLDKPAGQGAFDARIWIPWVELTKPFYVADECFLGASGDLRKVCNFDESYSLLWDIGCGVTHIRRFIHPFRQQSDLFEPFLESMTEAGHFRDDRREILSGLLADDRYLDALAAYYAVITSWFRVASPDGVITFRAWSSGAPQPAIGDMARAFELERDVMDGGGHLFAHGEDWIRAAVSGALTGELGKRFGLACERVRASGMSIEPPSAELAPAPTREPEVV